MQHVGRVFLVGAGPGDPELLTVKAGQLIATADVVVYDRLVSASVMEMVPAGVPRIDVGKQPRRHPVPQEQINALLVKLAGEHERVVRLKGGDPFIFGRGGEEAAALVEAGIPFEVVPGITSAQGAGASLKLPLTLRGHATGLRYLTGHCRQDGELNFDWQGLADSTTTLVVYMGLANIDEIATRLIEHGRDGATPVLAISNATLPEERHLVTTLAKIAGKVVSDSIEGPTLFIIGEVIGAAQDIGLVDHAVLV